MGPTSSDHGDVPVTIESRLWRLCDALHELPDAVRRSADHHGTRILLSIDDIVGRVGALAALLEEDTARERWDLVDHTTAQLLLRDLAVIARDLRAVAATVSTDLAAAESHIRGVEGVLQKAERAMQRGEDGAGPATPDAT